jgi:flagellar basal body-associated protein FliL
VECGTFEAPYFFLVLNGSLKAKLKKKYYPLGSELVPPLPLHRAIAPNFQNTLGVTAVANETKRPENPNSEETNTEPTAAKKSKFALFRSKTVQYWLAFLVVSSLVILCIGLAYSKTSSTNTPVEYSPEISMGNFEFTADKTAGGRIARAEFSLYITALEGLDRIARTRLASYKFRVQQDIELLLRQAHSGDFEDPVLSDLKRQIREQINQVLGNRVVSDVIITNLKIIASNNKEPPTTADTESSPPWLEKSSSYVSQQGGK